MIDKYSKSFRGAISGLRVQEDDHYAISGEFGTVALIAERPIPRQKGP